MTEEHSAQWHDEPTDYGQIGKLPRFEAASANDDKASSVASNLNITAAAADRTSFGCSDTRDLTYFGEAFYRDALPGATDLRTAFQRAKATIAQREQAEDIEASNPQAFFGAAIEKQLSQLGAQTR